MKLYVLKKLVQRVYVFIFARPCFQKFNKNLLLLNLNALGILNFENNDISGENNFLKKHFTLNSKAVVFDVGANIGDYALNIKAISGDTVIYAFEPNPNTFVTLVQNTKATNIICNNLGLGSSEAELTLYDYKGAQGSGHASLYPEVFDDLWKAEKDAIKVNILTIDKFCKDNQIVKIDFLKIDTEGNELEVLKGASELLNNKGIDVIQFEFNEMNIYSRVFFNDFIKILPNYNFFRLLPNDLTPLLPYTPLYNEIFAYQNIVAFRDDIDITNYMKKK